MEDFLHSGMGWKIFNFVVFVGLLVFLLKKHVVQFWQTRRSAISSQIGEAKELLAKAEERNRKLKLRAERIEHEMSTLIEHLKQEGETEKKKILERAEQQVVRLREDTEKIVGQEFKRAQEFLKREIVQSAVLIAEKIIQEKMSPEHQKKLNESTLRSLERQWQ